MRQARITLLGGFEVALDGHAVPDDGWRRRHAAGLVKFLAMAPNRRAHREQVLDALWPDHAIGDAAPKLHKATYFARRILGDNAAVAVIGETMALLPDHEVAVDVVEFESAATDALRDDDTEAMARTIDEFGDLLLPDDLYEEWLQPRRDHLVHLRTELLRRLERWDELVAIDPTDELAHVALMRALRAKGDLHGAVRQYERLERALGRELGVAPGDESAQLRDELLELTSVAPRAEADRSVELVVRADALAAALDLLDHAEQGRGHTVFVRGAPGSGTSTLLDAVAVHAEHRGCLVGRGVAASVEGSWPYAPVLEAFAELCRDDPSLLDRLDDDHRSELDRALLGSDLHWSGEGGHQRLFVAAAELLRIASDEQCVVLVIDDIHEADEASARLLHYLSRCATEQPTLIVLGMRQLGTESPLQSIRTSLVSRGAAELIELEPLDDARSRALVGQAGPDLDPATIERIVDLGAGVPFVLLSLARRAQAGDEQGLDSIDEAVLGGLAAGTRAVMQRAALLGASFDTDEFVAVTDLPDAEAFAHLDAALGATILEHTGLRYRFRHTLIRQALTADLPPHRAREIHRLAAERLVMLDASPARIGHHLMAAGDPGAAVPYLLRAADREAAVGAYRDAFSLVDQIQDHAQGDDRATALALRADLLFALGDPTAPAAYRQALSSVSGDRARILRTRLARAATVGGDLDTASAALEGLEPDGGAADPDVLLARANLAYFTGAHDEALGLAQEARVRVLSGDQTWQVLDLIALEGLLAHTRGEWFDRMRAEMMRTVEEPEIALAIFDGYLCPAEYLLYGPTPYEDVLALADRLRTTAMQAGALRAVAFAAALAGEASLLAGDLTRARNELEDAVALHREIGARSGEAHSLQRLAEVDLAEGDRATARASLQRALPLARWSPISLHLLQRIYGTMMAAAESPESALAVVERAEATLGTEDLCPFCSVMLAVPAATASADAGDLERADLYLGIAELSATMWEGTSWTAAIAEAKAHRLAAGGDQPRAVALWEEAEELFTVCGQPLDAARCGAHRAIALDAHPPTAAVERGALAD